MLTSLDERLENEVEVLDAFLLALARNQLPKEAWSKLHQAAQRDDRTAELAFAFEGLASDRKLRTLQAGVVAEFMFQSAIFFGDVMNDDLGAATYLDKAMVAMPTHAGSIARFEETLTNLASSEERTRFYPAVRTLRLSHGATELLMDWARLAHPGGVVLSFLDLDEADPCDREFVSVLLRRCDRRH